MKKKKQTDLVPVIQPESPYELGACVLIRTVTMYCLGRLIGVYPQELLLEDASWVACTGRWHECLMKGTLSESEPMPHGRVIVGRGAIVDVTSWVHALPRKVI